MKAYYGKRTVYVERYSAGHYGCNNGAEIKQLPNGRWLVTLAGGQMTLTSTLHRAIEFLADR